MKKSLILGILGLVASAVTTWGQYPFIVLDNYDSGPPSEDVVYGAGSGGTLGQGVDSSFTAGLYYVNQPGNYVSDFASDPTGTAIPTSLYSGPGTLTLATGTGATAPFFGFGEYASGQYFNPGIGGFQTITIVVIAYDNGSYGSAAVRGHSTAFTMTTGGEIPEYSGDDETDGGFAVFAVPEPSVLALCGLGASALWLLLRQNQFANRRSHKQ